MPQQRVDIPGVGIVEFPEAMGRAEIDAAAERLYNESQGELKWPPGEPTGRTITPPTAPARESLLRPSPDLSPVERANRRARQSRADFPGMIYEKPGTTPPPSQNVLQQTAFKPLVPMAEPFERLYPRYEGMEFPEQMERAVTVGMLRLAEGFTSPATIATIGVAGTASALSQTLRVLIGIGFTGQLAADTIIQAPELVTDVKEGRYEDAATRATQMVGTAGLAGMIGGHTLKAGRSHPAVTGRAMILDPRGPGGAGRPAMEPRVFQEGAGLEVLPAHETSLFPGRPTELPGTPAAGALPGVPRQPRPGVRGVPSTQGIYQRGIPPEPAVAGELGPAPGVDVPGAGPLIPGVAERIFRGGARVGEAPDSHPPVARPGVGEQTVVPTARGGGLFPETPSNVLRQQRMAPDFVGPPEPPVRPEPTQPLLGPGPDVALPPGGGPLVTEVQPGRPGGLGPFRQADIVPTGRPGVPARVREPGRFRTRDVGDPSEDLLTQEPTVEPEGPITPEVLPPEARVEGELTFEEAEAQGKVKVVKAPRSRWERGQDWYKENSLERDIIDEGGLKLDLKRSEDRAMIMPNRGATRDARSQNMFDPIRATKGEDAMTVDQMFEVLKGSGRIPQGWTQADFEAALSNRTPGQGGTFPLETDARYLDQLEAANEALRPEGFGPEVPEPVRPEVPGRVVPETPREIGEPPRTIEEVEADWERGRAQIKEMREDPNYAGTDFEKLEVDNDVTRQQNLQRVQPVKPTTIGPGFGPEEPTVAPEVPKADIPPRPKDTVTGETLRRETLEEMEARQEVVDKGFEDQIDAFREGYGEVGFQVPMRGEGRYAILHESTRPEEGAWQTSYFDDRGPSGHHMSQSWLDAVTDLQSQFRVDLSEARVKGQPNLDRAMTDMKGYDLEVEEARNRSLRGEAADPFRRKATQAPTEALTDADLERLRKPGKRGAPRPEVGEADFPGRVEPTVTEEGEPVSFAEGREAYQERIRQVEGWEIDLERAGEKRPPTPSEKLPIPPDVRGGVEVSESPEYKAFWEEHAAEYGKLSDIVDRIELSGLERAERARAEAVRIEAERRLAEIDNRSAEIPDEPTPGPKPVEPTEPDVTPEGQVEIVGQKGFERENKLADDKAKLEMLLSAKPDQNTAAGRKAIKDNARRERLLRATIADQERLLRNEPEQAGMFGEEEPSLFEGEPTVGAEGKPPEPLQDPLISFQTGDYIVERTATGTYDIYKGSVGIGGVIEGKKLKSFRYRTDAVQWATKQSRAEPAVQPELPTEEKVGVYAEEPTVEAEGRRPQPEPEGTKGRGQDYVDAISRNKDIPPEIAEFAQAYLDWKLGPQTESAPRISGAQAKGFRDVIDSLVDSDLPPRPGDQSTLYSNPIGHIMDVWSKNYGPRLHKYLFSTEEPYGLVVKPWPEPLKWLFINRHRQPPEWVEAHKQWEWKSEDGRTESFKLGKQMSQNLSQKDQLKLGELLRGEATEADLRAMRDNPQWNEAIDAVKVARARFDEWGSLAAQQGLLSEETFFQNYGKYMPRLYRRWEVDYDAQLKKYGATRPTRIDMDRWKKRGDIPEEVRVLMGEILEPGYPVAKGLSQIISSVETARLFNKVADHPDWTFEPEKFWDMGKDPNQYTQMPVDPKLGRLSGKYVNKYIASELNQMTRVRGEVSKVSRALVSEWKFNKVIFNPATHGRNMVSNTMLAYLSGLPPWRVDIYAKAMSELWQQKGPHYDLAKEQGLFSTTFAKGELDTLIDSWNSTSGGLYDRIGGMTEHFAKGELAEGLGKIRPSTTRFGQRAAKIYQGEEAWFKLAKYIQEIENGATPKAAAAAAQKALFDYTEVPPFVEWARTSPVGAPFITFSYKALPQILETGITHPWRLGSLVAGIYAMEEAARQSLGIEEDQMELFKRIMPERMKGNPLGLGPRALLLPYKDQYGQLQFMDLTYILPWGDVGEQGATGILQGTPGYAGPLRVVAELMLNTSGFTGQEIYNENDSLKDRTQKISDYLYKFAAPSLAPGIPGITEGGYGFERLVKSGMWIGEGTEDYFGRVSSPGTAIASAIIGMKTNPIDPQIEIFFRRKQFEDAFEDLEANAYRVRNHKGLSLDEKQKQLTEIQKKAQELRRAADEMFRGPREDREIQE
ncbi:MAG: hypothetical protein KAJ55_10105 [Anaerolineales bacterium]|nr:hypothetical protein [Anaerolineales bacterium]